MERDQAGHGRDINPLVPDLCMAEKRISELEALALAVCRKHRVKIAGKGQLWYFQYPSEEMEELAKALGEGD